jgi:hypothetical protein
MTAGWWDSIKTIRELKRVALWAVCVLSVLTLGVSKYEDAQQKRAKGLLEARLEELEKQHQPRTLKDDQAKTFLSVLESAPKGPVSISAVPSYPEAEKFANELAAALRSSGYEMMGRTASGLGTAPGVTLFVRSSRSPPRHALPILKALIDLGFKAQLSEFKRSQTNLVSVWVGPKP